MGTALAKSARIILRYDLSNLCRCQHGSAMYLMTDFIAPTCKAGHDGGRVHILSAMSHSTSRAKPPAPKITISTRFPCTAPPAWMMLHQAAQLLSQRRDTREAG